jgi:hypothetical protein
MINCEKVRLPRHIYSFCVSAVSRMVSRFVASRKCFFLLSPLQAAGLLGLRFRALNGVTSRAATLPREVPTGVGQTATWHMWHVSIAHWSTPFWSLLSMPRGETWHVLSPDSSTWNPLPRVKCWLVRTIFYSCRSGHVAYTWHILIGRSTLIELLIGRSTRL